ncbi:2-amino-4-hydroxy-6-hydroxymethyldihydropteridine diphosphokinase [Chromobacterium haemolyticum]|uniref:2-amino-4-hydroxy-6-hydroxymethyldihydropteridine pyrophosphokinase n=1 Tax=Chromobacterium fluminis TaxID=3044269 RepID=A0ABX0LEL5_9NEIS|nr:2-amino-4-hydroxy-6-hydroxymethyldihydropteridine diphosphokinase [Chromobacterium haemolyticum]
MAQAFIALGSNLEQPAAQIRAALAAIAALPDTELTRQSALYRTAPVGFADQPDFINAVAEVNTALAPRELLRSLLAIEAEFGRVRTFRNAPRVLDLDLLYYSGVAQSDEDLTLPHPRMHLRGFVMIPLAEIAPGLALPALGTAGELAAGLADQGVERLETTS